METSGDGSNVGSERLIIQRRSRTRQMEKDAKIRSV
jgi:hypothetical protein